MKMNFAFILLFSLVLNVFSQEQRVQLQSDETEAREEISQVGEEEENPEISPEKNGIVADLTDTMQEAVSRRVSLYLSVSPRIGSERMQDELAVFLIRRADSLSFVLRRQATETESFRVVAYQRAVAPGAAFNFEAGAVLNISEKSTLNFGGGFSFDRMRANYGLVNRVDSARVLRSTSSLTNNSFSFTLGVTRSFDTAYFSIDGVETVGVYSSAAFLFSRYFERDEIIIEDSRFSDFAMSRRKKHSGAGTAGRIGLFAEQKAGERSLFRYSIGYIIRVASGFEDFWDRDFLWEDHRSVQRILSISNGFELSFMLIF